MMISKVGLTLSVVAVTLLAFFASNRTPQSKAIAEPPGDVPTDALLAGDEELNGPINVVCKYASEDFFAACYVRPKSLAAHEYFNVLPIYRLVPASVSLTHLNNIQVQELVVFVGTPAKDSQLPPEARASNFQLAVAGRFAEPIDPQTLVANWTRPTPPTLRSEPKALEEIEIDNRRCYRVPAGTFLNSPRIYGDLRFIDRQGEPKEEGVNVGNLYERRSYIEGGGLATAIFTLDDIDESDLVDGHLPLELRPDVFRTYYSSQDYIRAQVVLKNPTTGLRSEPFHLLPKSHQNQELKIPQKLLSPDNKPGANKKKIDLLDDLVSKGRLQVQLTTPDRAMYIGVGRHDLNYKPESSEYLYVSDDEFLVAQSPATLTKMFRGADDPLPLAKHLTNTASDLTIQVKLENAAERRALKKALHGIDGEVETIVAVADSVNQLAATFNAEAPAKFNIAAQFADNRAALAMKARAGQLQRSLRRFATEQIGDYIVAPDVVGALMEFAFDGISMRFPMSNLPLSAVQRELQSITDQLLKSIQMDAQGNVLTVQYTEPKVLAQLSPLAQLALAWVEERHARRLFSWEKFAFGDEMFRRTTDRHPHIPQLWFRRAHHQAYNTSVDFDGFQSRYSWVHHGIETLLDGAERNPNTTDCLFMAGQLIGKKIGMADERKHYRQLFSADEKLHKRLTKFVDVETARSPDGKIDNWLVAQLIYQECIDRHLQSGDTYQFSPAAFYSPPARMQGHYAESLSAEGDWDNALEAWRDAEKRYRVLGEMKGLIAGAPRLRLDDLPNRLTAGAEGDRTKAVQKASRAIQYDYWLIRCELEQNEEIRSARKSAFEAKQQFALGKLPQSHGLHRQSLQALDKVFAEQPERLASIAFEFRRLAQHYRAALAQLNIEVEDEFVPLLKLIESAQPRSPFPFSEFEAKRNFGENDLLVP